MLERDDHQNLPTRTLAVLFAFAFALLPAGVAGASEGKTLYVENGCNKCHSLVAEGIAQVENDEADEEEDDPFGSDEDEAEPGDLSGMGAIWKEGDAGLQKWLTKKLEIDGKLHQKKFPGSTKDLKALTAWLMTLKEPAPAE